LGGGWNERNEVYNSHPCSCGGTRSCRSFVRAELRLDQSERECVCVCVCVSHSSSSSIHWPLHVQHSSSARRVIVACFYQLIQYVCLAPPLMHRHIVALRLSQQLCFRRAAWGLANGLLGLRIQATHELTVQTSTPTYRTVTHTLSYPFHQHVHHVSVSVALQTLSEPPRDHPPTHSLVQSHEQTQSSMSSTVQLVYFNAFHGLHTIRRRPSLDTIHKPRLVTSDHNKWKSSHAATLHQQRVLLGTVAREQRSGIPG